MANSCEINLCSKFQNLFLLVKSLSITYLYFRMALRATSLIGRVFNQRSVSKTFISKQPVFHNVRSRSLFSMPALDYDPKKGLKPLFSARSLAVHYQGVVGGQVVKLNKLVSGISINLGRCSYNKQGHL